MDKPCKSPEKEVPPIEYSRSKRTFSTMFHEEIPISTLKLDPLLQKQTSFKNVFFSDTEAQTFKREQLELKNIDSKTRNADLLTHNSFKTSNEDELLYLKIAEATRRLDHLLYTAYVTDYHARLLVNSNSIHTYKSQNNMESHALNDVKCYNANINQHSFLQDILNTQA
jgi:hypothetical protein